MSVDAMRIMRGIMRAYSLLHPSLSASRDVFWEMDADTADVLKRQMRWLTPGGSMPIFDIPGVELQCLGLRVSVVERPGVRLVIEAVRP